MQAKLSLFLLATTGTALAEPETLPPVVVTATMTAQSIDESLASVSVISREDIEQKHPLSVQDALRGIPGLNIGNTGGLGKQTGVFMRGTNANHVLVLIDGIRVGSATAGLTAFQDLPIDQVDRIEIVRGPRSSLYGSEAIGGVIQIFTRKGGGGFKPFLSMGGGSYDTYQLSAGLSGGDRTAWYSFSGAELYTGGINAYSGPPIQPDHDGYSNTSGSARFGYRFDNGLELEGNVMQAAGNSHYDDTSPPPYQYANRSHTMQQVIGGKLSFAPSSFWNTLLRAGTSADMSNDYWNQQFTSRFDTRRVTLTWQNDFTLAKDHLLTAGFDYYSDNVDATSYGVNPYIVKSRDNKAGFLQYQGALDRYSWNFAVRQDSNEQFGGKTTGSVALGYNFGEPLRLTASYGTAFKAPTFNDLYYFGNPHLKPESSQSVELGAKGKWAALNWAINGYYTQIDDLIAYDFAHFTTENISKAEIFGVEMQAATRLWGVDINANLSLLDPRNQADGPEQGNLLRRRAQQMFQLDLDRAFGKFHVGLTINQEGRRFEDAANTIRLHGFTTVGLRASYEIYKDVTVEGRASNLLNEHYQTAYQYNQMGTNLFLSVNWRPSATR
jgi:vitamin B12 transporter